jgi:hypothetical protein
MGVRTLGAEIDEWLLLPSSGKSSWIKALTWVDLPSAGIRPAQRSPNPPPEWRRSVGGLWWDEQP